VGWGLSAADTQSIAKSLSELGKAPPILPPFDSPVSTDHNTCAFIQYPVSAQAQVPSVLP